MPEPKSYDPRAFPPFAVTVDVVVFTILERRLSVALIVRGQPPFESMLALPGGFVRPDESLDQAAVRELAEETGLRSPAPHLEQFGVYGTPDRDPRMRVVSVGYWAIVPDLEALEGGTDAASANLVPVDKALEQQTEMAFDHHLILSDALEHARRALETSTVATAFCGDELTIPELRRVYETVWDVDLDPGNFQNRVTETPGFVVPTGKVRHGGQGRPPELYRAGPAVTIDPPLRRPPPVPNASKASAFVPAVERLGFAPLATENRFLEPGWVYQGVPPISCPGCGGGLHVWRKPYESNGRAYRYWAVVCEQERIVRDLRWFGENAVGSTKELRRWSDSVDRLQTLVAAHDGTAIASAFDKDPPPAQRRSVHRQRRGLCRRCGKPTSEPWHTLCDRCYDLVDPSRQARRDSEQDQLEREARERGLRRRAGSQNYGDDT